MRPLRQNRALPSPRPPPSSLRTTSADGAAGRATSSRPTKGWPARTRPAPRWVSTTSGRAAAVMARLRLLQMLADLQHLDVDDPRGRADLAEQLGAGSGAQADPRAGRPRPLEDLV